MGDVMQLDLRLREQLRKTDDLIASLHRDIAADPDSLSLQVTLVSLEKRQRKLEKELIFEMEVGAGRLLEGVEPRHRDAQ